MTHTDPQDLSLDDLRALRNELQEADDVVSYVRRLAQARYDLVRAEVRHRAIGDADTENLSDELSDILSTHLTGGGARPPRPADDFSEHPLAIELAELSDRHGGGDIESLSDQQLASLQAALHEYEQARSAERRALFDRIDTLSAELVRRYRDGEANVDLILDDN
jgi:hypothetical protein